jgi:hypothetical protein
MRTTGAMGAPARKRFPLAPVVVAAVVAVAAVGAGLAWERSPSTRDGAPAATRVEGSSQDPEVALRAHMADALRHRADLAGAEGTAVLGSRILRQAVREATVARVLRYFPTLTAREAARMEFGEG